MTVWGIVLIVTITLFFLSHGLHTEMEKAGLLYLVLAETILFAGLLLTERLARTSCGIIIRAGGYSVLTLFAAASILLTILFLTTFPNQVVLFSLLQIVFFAIAAVLYFIIWGASRRSQKKNRPAVEAHAVRRGLCSRAEQMAKSCGDSAAASGLNEVSEGLRFGEFTVTQEMNRQVSDELDRIETLMGHRNSGDRAAEIEESIAWILTLIRQTDSK